MKPQQIEAFNPEDTWQRDMPRAFWTAEARRLFHEATKAGLLSWIDEADRYAAGPGVTKAQLAYWCKKASTYLGIDRGGTTNWRPFEAVFGYPAGKDFLTGEAFKASNPLKAALNNIGYTAQAPDGARAEYTAPIDLFFESLKASTNEE